MVYILKETLEIRSRYESRLVEMDTGRRRDFESKLAETMQHLRQDYEVQLQQYKADLDKTFSSKVLTQNLNYKMYVHLYNTKFLI